MREISSPGRALAALSIAAACASAVPASAATVLVVDRTLAPTVKVSGAEFDVDERTGNVRLAVDFLDDSWEGNLFSESFAVPGLRFDRARREVLYEREGSVVTCARRRKFLWGTSYPATDACRIHVTSPTRKADTGSGVGGSTNWVVALETDETTVKAAAFRH